LDLLREINNRIRTKIKAESGRAWEKLYDFAYGATVGLAKEYRDKTLKLVKVQAASAYLQAIRILRRHAQLLFIAVFAAIMLSVTVVIVPIALVLSTDWTGQHKVAAVAALGIMDLVIVYAAVHHVYSEEKWMKRTGFAALLESLDLPDQDTKIK
jgi:hypothetical protein